MNVFLIHRLRNAAIAADQRRDFAMAELLTEVINELEAKSEHEKPESQSESAARS